MDVFTIGLLVLSIIVLLTLVGRDVRPDGPLFTFWNILYGIGYLAILVGAESITERISTRIFRQEPLEHAYGDGNPQPAANTSLLPGPVTLSPQTLKYAVPIILGILCGLLNFLDTLNFIWDQILPSSGAHDDPKAWTSHITLLIVATWLWVRVALARRQGDDPTTFAHAVQRDGLILMLLPILTWSTETMRWYAGHPTALSFGVAFVQPGLAGWCFVWAGRTIERSEGRSGALAWPWERTNVVLPLSPR